MELIIIPVVLVVVLVFVLINAGEKALVTSLDRSIMRAPLNQLLNTSNSSTWMFERVSDTVFSDGYVTTPPPHIMTIVGDEIGYLVKTNKYAAGCVVELSYSDIIDAFYTPGFRRQGRILSMEHGVGAVSWGEYEDSRKEVVWVTWEWERLADAKHSARTQKVLLAVTPGENDDEVEVAWGVIDREITPHVDRPSDVKLREKSLRKCRYRAVVDVDEEIARVEQAGVTPG